MIYTPVYYKTMDAIARTDRFVSSRGGTRSGKTFSNLQALFLLAVQDKSPSLTSVVSETFPHLKRGAIRDFQEALGDYWRDSCWSKGESIYTLPNGSQIEFFSADAPAKVHGPARDRLFLNEIQNIPYETARQLFVRTRGLILMDYNPTASFWGNELVETRDDCITIESTYRDNSFLTPEQVREIEANRNDTNWWTVYGEGRFGTLEGVIYNFEQVDALPDDDNLREVWGMDFGFTCFEGGTLITTARGDIPIRDIMPGDLVLTRDGFHKVVEKKHNGIEEVIEKFIIFDNGETTRISATYNHNFNVNGKWKQYGKLEEGDKLFIVSPSTAWSIEDTPPGNTPTTTITNGKRTAATTRSSCTRPSGRRPTGCRSRKVTSSTISIGILSTTSQTISSSSRLPNIAKYIATSLGTMKHILTTRAASLIRAITGPSVGPWLWNACKLRPAYVNNAGASTSPQTSTSVSARNNATIAGNTPARTATSTSFASAAARPSGATNISNQRPARQPAPIVSRAISSIEEVSRRRTDVYDLWVDGVHEYFANGVLVHNCDPTAIVRILADTGRRIAYIDEIVYQTGMLNADIARVLENAGARRGVPIWADAADPKSIAEIGAASGLNIQPCDKGAPVRSAKRQFQIQWLQGWQLRPTKRSLNWIREARNYTWAKDRNGTLTGYPIEAWDHLMDATRYALYSEFAGRESSGQYYVSRIR